ncbi:MAG TPA: YeeE/YedE family protein [Hyphomicrobiaceae bacterium]|nr:YeeE/YedE family protein [Hyphomicrobiaceae bacterium]
MTMSSSLTNIVTAALIGLLFGLGIAISGMGNPAKVLAFFDVAGAWDPSLAFVMGGALIVTAVGYRLVFKRNAPVLASRFNVPAGTAIDTPLVAGSAVFGIGWGLTGFCPGGVIPMLGLGRLESLAFFAAFVVGIALARKVRTMLANARRGSVTS